MSSSNVENILRHIVSHIEETDKRHTDAMNELKKRLDGLSLQSAASSETSDSLDNRTLRDLENQVSKLSSRAENMVKTRSSLSTRQKIEGRISEMADRLANNPESSTDDSTDQHGNTYEFDNEEQAMSALAAAYDAQDLNQETVPSPAARMNSLNKTQFTSDTGPSSRLQSSPIFENQSTPTTASTLSEKERLLQERFADIADRLEETLNAPQGHRDEANDLTAQLDALSSKFETVIQSNDGNQTLDNLQSQFHEISSYIERSEQQFARIDSIESNIVHLMDMIKSSEENMAAYTERAVEETATKIASQMPGTSSSEEIDELSQSIRALADEKNSTDSRTVNTLDAIHDSLREMVARIESIETGLNSSSGHHQDVFAHDGFQPNNQEQNNSEPQRHTGIRNDPVGAENAHHDTDWSEHANIDPRSIDTSSTTNIQPRDQAADVFATSGHGSEHHAPASQEAARDELVQEWQKHTPQYDVENQRYDTSSMDASQSPKEDFVAAARRASQAAASPSGNNDFGSGRASADSLRQVVKQSIAREEYVEENRPREKSGPSSYQFAVASGAVFALAAIAGLMFSQSKFGTMSNIAALTGNQKSIESTSPATTGSISENNRTAVSTDLRQPVRNSSQPMINGNNGLRTGNFSAPEQSLADRENQHNTSTTQASTESVSPSESSDIPLGTKIGHVSERSIQRQLNKAAHRRRIEELTGSTPNTNSEGIPSIARPFSNGLATNSVGIPATSPLPQDGPLPQEGRIASTNAQALPPAGIGPLSLRIAASKGSPTAEYEIGSRFAKGIGVKQDIVEASRWFKRSSSKGFVPAQYRLATLYERGRGLQKDLGRAKTWYRRAAEQGNIKAMHNLAVLYTGREGEAPDYGTAAGWFKLAAEHGLADSQFNLAVLYQNGMGVEKNLVEAYRWLTLAAIHGDSEAGKRKESLRSQLSSSQIANAERQALSWTAKPIKKSANSTENLASTWQNSASLYTPSSATAVQSNLISRAQSLLTKLGYNTGPADGQMGPKTRDAIKIFQSRSGMKVTGEVSPNLISKLSALAI